MAVFLAFGRKAKALRSVHLDDRTNENKTSHIFYCYHLHSIFNPSETSLSRFKWKASSKLSNVIKVHKFIKKNTVNLHTHTPPKATVNLFPFFEITSRIAAHNSSFLASLSCI